METKKVNLKFDKMLTFISGRQLGNKIYREQVKNMIEESNRDEKVTIVFPESISYVSISFVKGLFGELISKYGISFVYEKFDFIAKDTELSKKIREDILF